MLQPMPRIESDLERPKKAYLEDVASEASNDDAVNQTKHSAEIHAETASRGSSLITACRYQQSLTTRQVLKILSQ